MDEFYFIYAAAGLVVLYFMHQVATRSFDPFAPVWLFLMGYVQIYFFQAIIFHDWVAEVRGKDLVAAASFRSFWVFLCSLFVYHLGPARPVPRFLPPPPQKWSPLLAGVVSPP